MDMLKMGMAYADSQSIVKRTAARCMLACIQKKADRYEKYVMKQKICIPEDAQENAAMLNMIYKRIAEQSSASTAANEIKRE